MRIHVLSDLHLEFLHLHDGSLSYELPNAGADVVVLAGDIELGTKGLTWALREAHRLDVPILYVNGNHEYYYQDATKMREAQRQLVNCQERKRLHLLDPGSVVIDGVRFLGCTLWTDFNLLGPEKQGLCRNAGHALNDYRLVRYKGRTLQPNDTQQWHFNERRWLAERLDTFFDGPTVVITHHAPSKRSQHPKYPLDEVSASFQSNLEALMGQERVAVWIHGHTHACVDFEVNGTRVIANQQGYPNEPMPGYRDDLVVELDSRRLRPVVDEEAG